VAFPWPAWLVFRRCQRDLLAASISQLGLGVDGARRPTHSRLPRTDMRAGDVLFGLPSSGPHSNGFSLVRKIVSDCGLSWSDPAPFAAGRPTQRCIEWAIPTVASRPVGSAGGVFVCGFALELGS
jgi:hypothetical protein